MLREGDDDPERRLEVVDVDVEGRVLALPEDVVVFGEALLEGGAVDAAVQHLLLAHFAVGRRVAVAYVHLEFAIRMKQGLRRPLEE